MGCWGGGRFCAPLPAPHSPVTAPQGSGHTSSYSPRPACHPAPSVPTSQPSLLQPRSWPPAALLGQASPLLARAGTPVSSLPSGPTLSSSVLLLRGPPVTHRSDHSDLLIRTLPGFRSSRPCQPHFLQLGPAISAQPLPVPRAHPRLSSLQAFADACCRVTSVYSTPQ